MVHALSAFLDFCYLVRRSVIDEVALDAIDNALARFHRNCIAFCAIRPGGFSLPRQHSHKHYRHLIQLFGAPNGLCSSITESKHIKAVKELWRCSSHFEALGQMLLTNQRIDKLAACRVDFKECGMLLGSCAALIVPPEPAPNLLDVPVNLNDGDSDPADGPRIFAQVILAKKKGMPVFLCLLFCNHDLCMIQHLVIHTIYSNSPPQSIAPNSQFLSDIFSLINFTHIHHYLDLKLSLTNALTFVAKFPSSNRPLPCFLPQVTNRGQVA